MRDRINAMKRIREKQKVVRATYKSEDVIARPARRNCGGKHFHFQKLPPLR
ncbi:MAG: hypothetical protein ACLR56_00765 [Oscillospiraceae bacterium]